MSARAIAATSIFALRDEAGAPVFLGEDGHGPSDLFRQFMAGMLRHAPEIALFFAPNINSYKRYTAGSFAPTALAWGLDNRTCAFRVLGHGQAIRVENRLPGGDVNPYLALAAMIAAGLAGIEGDYAPVELFTGNAYAADLPRGPATLAEAAKLFTQSAFTRAAFGEKVVTHYANMAKVELDAFNAAVTDWERFQVVRADVIELSKRFFLKKKNQKIFGPGGVGAGTAHGPGFKVFLLLFVHKKKKLLNLTP